METLLTGLRAAAEPTRLRLLAACAEGELTGFAKAPGFFIVWRGVARVRIW